jgi:hypothetical protein
MIEISTQLNDEAAALVSRPKMPDISRFTPEDFRLAITDQIRNDNMPMAEALGEAGLSLFPNSQDVLAIVALLSEIKQDWTGAEQLLAKLIKMQNELSPPATWQHWIRVLRCNGKPFEALQVSEKSLRLHPGDENLVMESQSLMDWIGTSTLVSGNESVN